MGDCHIVGRNMGTVWDAKKTPILESHIAGHQYGT
jgi:hypothetical protein